MKADTRIYRVELFGSPDSVYYMASDINAVFERGYHQRVKRVELVSSLFEVYNDFNDKDTNCFLFDVDYTLTYDKIRDRSTFIIAPTMKDAYNVIYNKKEPKENLVIQNIVCVAPINYVKSYREMDDEVEAMRIG